MSVCKQMCKQIQRFKGSDLSLFGFQNQRNFGATVSHFVAPNSFCLKLVGVTLSNARLLTVANELE